MEMINHFSHEEHQLILKEMKEEDNKEVVCYGCEKSVSGSTYCCSVCEVFLHKSCAELPLEFTHPMHYEHPLQLFSKPTYGSESCICNICRRSWSGFTYHCSECYFDVDVLCAKLEMLKHTMDGKHPLILKELKAGSSADVVCYGCQQPVSGSTYWCSECEVFLHKSCAELPLEFTHPVHSEHPLVLLVKPPYKGGCDICRRSLSGFTYNCFKCKFDVDALCAKLEIFKHTMDGKHPLILKELQQEDMSSEKVVCCGLCEQLIVSGSSTYFCSICEVFLHISCAQLPSQIMHPTHTACHDPLKLLAAKSPSGSTCNICDRSCGSGLAYCCLKCEFYLDVLCAQSDGTLLKHPSHQHHLKLQRRNALFRCDACGIKEEDESYGCTVCSFWIHKSCGSLLSKLSHKCHPHPLDVAYCFPEKYRHYGLKCDICREKLHPNYWLLYCAPCRYFVHIKCITSYSEAAEANSVGEIPPNWISLPTEVLSAQLIRHFLEEEGLPVLIEQPKEKFNHFSHDHPLILTNIQDDYSEMDGDDQETVCSACIEPISGSCYGCAQCSYFIHLHCADQLPNNLSSSYHPQHQLSLNHCSQEFFGYFRCSCCDRECNGFFYECKECEDFSLDINCALFPPAIKHEAHHHFLFRGEYDYKFCNACNSGHFNVFFSCKTCDEYNLAMGCATCPQTVRHRWDKHPLKLSFPPFYYHPDEFICDICEEEAHPKYWLYHCRECDNSFHLKCIPRLGEYDSKLKFGGKLQIEDHLHPLTFMREVKYKFCCKKCDRNLKGSMGFECETCYFNLCQPCVRKIVDSSSEKSSPKEHSEIEESSDEESSPQEHSEVEKSSDEESSPQAHCEIEESSGEESNLEEHS